MKGRDHSEMTHSLEVMISARRIRDRVKVLTQELNRDFQGRDVVVVALLKGTVVFLADLIRGIEFPMRLDFMGVSSYGSKTQSGKLIVTQDLRMDVRDRHVLLVDDILDTGRTLHAVQRRLRRLQPASLRTCVLLDKPERREKQVPVEYVGFRIPNRFVVGYGLDWDEHYRNLPHIGVVKTAA